MGALRLQRYLAHLALTRLLLVLLLLVAVYAVIDLVEARSMTAGGDASSLVAVYPLRLPSVLTHVLPLAAILGPLLALGALRRHGEWEALLAAGVAPWRLLGGLCIAPALAFMVMAPLMLELAPRANAAWSRAVSPDAGEARGSCGRWLALDGATLAWIEPGDAGWEPVTIVELPGETRRGKRVAIRGRPAEDNAGAEIVSARRAAAVFEELAGSDGRSWSGLAGQTLSRGRLDASIDAMRSAGIDTADLEAERALRRSLILATALLPLFGLMLAARAALIRAGALTGLGLALGVAYWLLTAVAWNGAATGAWSAAWICPVVPAFVVAAMVAVAVLRRKRRPTS